jgi:formate dehydrogenase iron-sulfur subunit
MAGPNSLFGPIDPATDAGYTQAKPRMGFFTDTSVCIGCKACEVACKEWNAVPDDGFNLLGMSYDNTGSLSANTWRHVAFVEQSTPSEAAMDVLREAEQTASTQFLGMPSLTLPGATDRGDHDLRWLMMSDVC